ncbi:MAG: polysaccharide deacetylase family protein [Lachnospiraceae bacterium]|nr:polysaccharide deacetylase family protein [Lachnospiraceae bacterium]
MRYRKFVPGTGSETIAGKAKKISGSFIPEAGKETFAVEKRPQFKEVIFGFERFPELKKGILSVTMGVVCLASAVTFTGCGKGSQDTVENTSQTVATETEATAPEETSAATDGAVEGNSSPENQTVMLSEKGRCNLHLGEYVCLPDRDNLMGAVSKKESVATVSKTGIVYAKKPGRAVIVARDSNGDDVRYRIRILKKGFMYDNLEMMQGEVLPIKNGFSNKATGVRWRSRNNKIARVNKKGNVVARRVGNVRIIGRKDGRTFICHIKVIKRIKSVIYLTFDDGPSSNITPRILNILKRNHVNATFFELRPASYDYHITRRLIREGNTLALHGFQHDYYTIYKSKKIYHQNLDKLQRLFYKEFGVWCTASRFPGGSSNTVSSFNRGIMTKITKCIGNWRYTYYDWSVSSGDAGLSWTPKAVYNSVVSGLVKGQENIVLMHDAAPKTYTAGALDKIIKYGKKHGFTFRAITPSTKPFHHGVNN